MGTLMRFPDVPRAAARDDLHAGARRESATIIILPVIRIERADKPFDGLERGPSPAPGRKRRRHTTRS
jgi:hypothetical protein